MRSRRPICPTQVVHRRFSVATTAGHNVRNQREGAVKPTGSRYVMLFVVMCAWMTDAAVSLLYSYVISSPAGEWNISLSVGGPIGFVPMAGGALEGPLLGYIADKFGRKISLQL